MFPSLQYLDRYRNEETRTYSKHSAYSEAERRYQPTSDNKSFPLPGFEIPLAELNVYTANPPKILYRKYISGHKALFYIHPQVLENFPDDPYIKKVNSKGKPASALLAVPSSSTRTLYINDPCSHALKVHFPFRVSRYDRKMRDEVIEQAVNVSLDLEDGIEHFDDRFAFLREVIGISHRVDDPEITLRGANWGYLVRDMSPFPGTDDNRYLVPGFALYGKDYFDHTVSPLLHDLFFGPDLLEKVVRDIMLPIISHWVQCFRAFGYILEPHGQNVLLEFDRTGSVMRIVHRDLSTGIDMRRRRDNNLASDHLNRYNRMESSDFSSIAYDMFIGSHFFDRIISCCREKAPHLATEDFRRPCREHFSTIFPEHARYLPKTVHYFSEKRDRFNKPLYRDTGRKPNWRP